MLALLCPGHVSIWGSSLYEHNWLLRSSVEPAWLGRDCAIGRLWQACSQVLAHMSNLAKPETAKQNHKGSSKSTLSSLLVLTLTFPFCQINPQLYICQRQCWSGLFVNWAEIQQGRSGPPEDRGAVTSNRQLWGDASTTSTQGLTSIYMLIYEHNLFIWVSNRTFLEL